MKQIDISTKTFPNTFAIVDDEDFERLNQWKWHNDNGYAYRRVQEGGRKGKIEHVYMQNLVINREEGKTIDHKNGDRLDNRKCNLRTATWNQNMVNRKIGKNNSSGYKGVSFSNEGRRIKRWTAQIHLNNKHIHVGRFMTKEEAARAYNEAAKKHFGEFAYLNNF